MGKTRIHTIILHILVLVVSTSMSILKSQTTFPEDSVFNQVDTLARFPGGVEALDKYIHQNTYEYLTEYGISEDKSLWVSFIVERDGSPSNIVCMPDSLDWIINFVKFMPKWRAAIIGNQIVRSRVILPINFEAALASKKKLIKLPVNTEDLGFFSIGYQYSIFSSAIADYLESAKGLELEFSLFGEYESKIRFGGYFILTQPIVIKPYDNNTPWRQGEKSNLVELGQVINFKLLSTNNAEFIAFNQVGFNYQTPSRRKTEDSLRVRNSGFSCGFGINFLYFFNPRASPHKIAINLKVKIQQIFLGKPLNGQMQSLNMGLVYFFR